MKPTLLQKFTARVMIVLVLLGPYKAWGSGIPTIDIPGLAATIAQIVEIGTQIQKISSVVGLAEEQLGTLKQVQAGIRDMKSVLSGGTQGLLGEASDKLGLKQVFTLGKELQNTVSAGVGLYQDVKALPKEAKDALKGVGLAVEDVEKYLSSGLVYDAYQGMQIDEWRQIFKNPIDGFVTGAVGRTARRSESYLDTESLRAEYAGRLAGMSDADKQTLSGAASLDLALMNFGVTAKDLDKRIAKSLNYSLVADKMADAAGSAADLLSSSKVSNAAAATQIKISAEAARTDDTWNSQMVHGLQNQTTILSERERRAREKEASDAIIDSIQ